jgi:hypothetical protein
VGGFEAEGGNFINAMRDRGLQQATAHDVLPLLIENA